MAEKTGFFNKIKTKIFGFTSKHSAMFAIAGSFISGAVVVGSIAYEWATYKERKRIYDWADSYEKELLEQKSRMPIETELSESEETPDTEPFYLCLRREPYLEDDNFEGAVKELHDMGLLVINTKTANITNKDDGEIISEGIGFKLKELREGAKEDLRKNYLKGGYEFEYEGFKAYM